MIMVTDSFFTCEELKRIGFRTVGSNVVISRFARFYGADKMEIGNNVRIDDFCILSGSIKLGNYIHISAFSACYARYGLEMEDYTGLSPRCSIFSASDDFSGNYLISPMVPDVYTNVTGGKVLIRRFSQVGASSVILPNVVIDEGVAIGAMSLVKTDLEAWGIYAGNPLRRIKDREKGILRILANLDNHIL